MHFGTKTGIPAKFQGVILHFSSKTAFLAKFLGQFLHFSSKLTFPAKFLSQILYFSSKTAFLAKFQNQILHFASKTTFLAKLADTRHKENGFVRKYINICYLLSPFRHPPAHSAASYHIFSKAEQVPAPLQNRAFLCQQTM